MPLSFLLDEHLRSLLWNAIQQHNLKGMDALDVVRVGDLEDVPCGSRDSEILLWCEQEARILVSLDKSTLGRHLAEHLQAGHHSPGVFIVKTQSRLPDAVDFLALVAYASDPLEWRDRIEYIG